MNTESIAKGARVNVSEKWSWIDGYAATGRVTSLKGLGVAGVRLDNGKLRDFPVADLTPTA
jgi:hypothetical protein